MVPIRTQANNAVKNILAPLISIRSQSTHSYHRALGTESAVATTGLEMYADIWRYLMYRQEQVGY